MEIKENMRGLVLSVAAIALEELIAGTPMTGCFFKRAALIQASRMIHGIAVEAFEPEEPMGGPPS